MTSARSIAALAALWAGEDAFVVGTGPSMDAFDHARLAGRKTIALNDAALRFQPSVHLFSDVRLWPRYRTLVHGATVCCRGSAYKSSQRDAECLWRDRAYSFRLSPSLADAFADAGALAIRRTVAAGGIQLAWLLGCRRAYLLGVDAYVVEGGRQVVDGRCRGFIEDMRALRVELDAVQGDVRGTEVVNLSPDSRVDAWPREDAGEALGT